MLRPGDKAPDFTLMDQNNKPISLSDFRGQKNVVLFFYPKDNTPGCTAESCSFRDNYAGFSALGAQVIGISDDPPESHSQFAEQHRLPYPLLTDMSGHVKKQFGVRNFLFFIKGRATFVIDKDGVIRHVVSDSLKMDRHIDESLRAVQQLIN